MFAELQRKLAAPAFRELARQLVLYGLVGGAQLVLDYLVFVALTATGLGIVPSNLIARVVGACLGYFLNRSITFARDMPAERRESAMMLRFGVVWGLLTLLGTFALGWLGSVVSLKWVWIAKPAVDAALAALGFVMSRYWIYK